MSNILLLLIFAGLVGLLLVVFYLLDRVNALHMHGPTVDNKQALPTDLSFGSLQGKKLWDAITGVPTPGWDASQIETMKHRYEMVLQKHIEGLFEDGKLDGLEGFSMPVSSSRKVPTLRGEIESWIPHEFASPIYRAGNDKAKLAEEHHGQLRALLDQTGQALFTATSLPSYSLSNFLMPLPKPKGDATVTEDMPAETTTATISEAPPALEAPAEDTTGAALLTLTEEAMPAEPVAAEPAPGDPAAAQLTPEQALPSS